MSTQNQKTSIGIYIPRWLCRSDESDQLFADELFKIIEYSKKYRPLLLDLPRLRFSTERDAKEFADRNNLIAVVQHDSEFYKRNSLYADNIRLLEKHVTFFNSLKCQELAHDKISTNKLLREKNIPVLDTAVVSSKKELKNHMLDGESYVVKPHNCGAGKGVRLIRKDGGRFFGYYDGQWRIIEIIEKKHQNKRKEIKIKYSFDPKSPFLIFKKLLTDFTYSPMLVEPYFNNHNEGFSSLRCTVIGNEVVEAVKRTNHKNITSNISSGGRAVKIELSNEQKEAAIAATRAIGANYAGVDFLVRGNEWVVGEVNIGPFTVFMKYTGVNVGKIFGNFVMRKCDEATPHRISTFERFHY